MVADKKKSGAKLPKLHYLELVEEAIVSLKSRTGCSLIAIEKKIKEANPGIEIKHALLRLIMKKAVESGRFKVHRFHSGSYMLATPKPAGKKASAESNGALSPSAPKKRRASTRASDVEKPAKKAKKSTSRSSSLSKKEKAVKAKGKSPVVAAAAAKKSVKKAVSPVAKKSVSTVAKKAVKAKKPAKAVKVVKVSPAAKAAKKPSGSPTKK